MKDENAQHLLAKVMGWQDQDVVLDKVPVLRLLADYKYDGYQRFGPGKRFVESIPGPCRRPAFAEKRSCATR
jgi:hypothetical protein